MNLVTIYQIMLVPPGQVCMLFATPALKCAHSTANDTMSTSTCLKRGSKYLVVVVPHNTTTHRIIELLQARVGDVECVEASYLAPAPRYVVKVAVLHKAQLRSISKIQPHAPKVAKFA